MRIKFKEEDFWRCCVCGRSFLDDGYVDEKRPLCIPCYAESIGCEVKVVEKSEHK